jgi:hypothetical protein
MLWEIWENNHPPWFFALLDLAMLLFPQPDSLPALTIRIFRHFIFLSPGYLTGR